MAVNRSQQPFVLSRVEARTDFWQRIRPSTSSGRTIALAFSLLLVFPLSLRATVQQEVYITGHVQPFGGYKMTEAVAFEIREPGKQEIGRIIVDGLYNGEYPWVMRCYTDNLHFSGVGGALRTPSPGGLVSTEGQFVIPLSLNCPNFGPDTWRRIPDLGDPGTVPYAANPEPGEVAYTDCIVMGIDPRNGAWVAGPDELLYTADDNFLGDTTVATPFEIVLQADVPASAVRGRYDATLYFEIVAAP